MKSVLAVLAASLFASSALATPIHFSFTNGAAAAAADQTATLPAKVTEFAVSYPAFLKINNNGATQDLIASQFKVLSTDKITVLGDVSGQLTSAAGAARVTPITKTVSGSITWPNEVTDAPASVFGQQGNLVGGGFLVPGSGNGKVTYFNTKTLTYTPLTTSSSWFYHRALVYDVDKDGLDDIITCRANKPLIGSTKAELAWLKPVDRANPLAKAWTEFSLGTTCDVNFRIHDIDGDGIDEIIATQFFSSKLVVYYTTDPQGRWSIASAIKSVVVDSNVGAAFDLEVVDLNNDGKLDLLVGNGKTPSSSVYAYEFPKNFKTDAWTRHTLATDFKTLNSGTNEASPGSPITFFPTVGAASNKPYIALAGDGAQKAFLLTPKSESASDWEYNLEVIHDCKGTVGMLAVGDVNNDGAADIFVPCYDGNVIAAYSYGKF